LSAIEISTVRVRTEAGVVRVLLDRPERGNALDGDTVEALLQVFDQAERDGAAGLVLQGSGRHFCSGFDLPEGEARDGDLLLRFVRIEELLRRCFRAPFVTIAIAHGRTFGAGADLFTACDRRIALPGASFAFPGARFGLLLGTGRLIRRVGLDAARVLVRTGQAIDAEAARVAGLATHCAEAATVEALVAGLLRPGLDRQTIAALHRFGGGERQAEDDTALAELVRSASVPGLARRIAAYRAEQRAKSGRPAG
jgi:enoyl-CoA hydratase/carnithine racemase